MRLLSFLCVCEILLIVCTISMVLNATPDRLIPRCATNLAEQVLKRSYSRLERHVSKLLYREEQI